MEKTVNFHTWTTAVNGTSKALHLKLNWWNILNLITTTTSNKKSNVNPSRMHTKPKIQEKKKCAKRVQDNQIFFVEC